MAVVKLAASMAAYPKAATMASKERLGNWQMKNGINVIKGSKTNVAGGTKPVLGVIRRSENRFGLSSSEVDKAVALFEEVSRDWG